MSIRPVPDPSSLQANLPLSPTAKQHSPVCLLDTGTMSSETAIIIRCLQFPKQTKGFTEVSSFILQ